MIPIVFFLWVCFSLGRKVIPLISGLCLAIANVFYGIYEHLEGAYKRIFFPLFTRPTVVLVTAILVFLGSLPILFSLGQSLLPEIHQGRFTADVAFAIGTPLGKTSSKIVDVEQEVSNMKNVQYSEY